MKELPPRPEEPRNFMLVCSAHGELGVVPETLIRVLEKTHREAMGCYFEIKVYEKEEYEANK